MEKISKVIPVSKTNLFYKNKLIITSNTLKKLEEDIKKNITNPKKDKDVYIVRVVYNEDDDDNILVINCSKKIITSELKLNNVIGTMKTIIYTKDDLEKHGFKKNHITKIINAVNKGTKNTLISINDIL